MQKQLKSNIWKYFLLILTGRRNYIPILSLYFLSLPNTIAQQIGIFTGIGWFVGFFMEIPSGYLSDNFGHKKTLIFAKFSMLLSTLFFVFGGSLPFFILGSSFMAIGVSFMSGTSEAFLHNTLSGLKKEKRYGQIDGKIKAKVSLISVLMILALPLLTKISLLMPIKIYLGFDILGIIISFTLFSPKIKYAAEDIEGEKIFSQLKRFRGRGFYIFSLFVGIITAFIFGLSPYKEPFVVSLGFPIILIGSIMALSRFIWFIIGHNLKFLEKIKIKRLLFYEIFFFSGIIILISQLKNPYLIGLMLSIILGYYHARRPLIQEYYLNNFLINKRYKATMLSIKSQFEKIFQSAFIFLIGFIMTSSFRKGFLISGISLLILLLIVYPFLKINKASSL